MDLSFKPKVWLFIMLVVATIFFWIFRDHFFHFSMLDTEDTSIRRTLAERWAQRASVIAANDERLVDVRPTIEIARVVNDYDGLLTQQLKNWIGRRNVRVVNGRWFHDMGYTTGVNSEPNSIEGSVKECQSANADFIVATEIENWTTFPEFDRELSGWLQIHDGHDGRLLKRVKLSTSEGSLPIRKDGPSMALADQHPREEATPNIPVNGHYRQPYTEPKSLISGVSPTTSESLSSEKDVAKSIFAEANPKPSEHWKGLGYLGVGLWFFCLLAAPWAIKRKIGNTLHKNSNLENGRLLLFWVIGVAFSAVFVWASWLPIPTAMIIAALVTVFACIYFGICCKWIAVQ